MIIVLIKCFFMIVILSVFYIVIKKARKENKRKWVMLLIFIAVFLPLLSAFYPIENAFITFPTVESAYYYSKEGYIKHIIQGNESDLVIGQKENDTTNILAVMPKTNDGWKISSFGSLKRVTSTISHDVSIHVYQYKNSDDYYIVVYGLKEAELEVIDNRNSLFDCLEWNNKPNRLYYKYCSYIHCFDENYVITVDGNPVSFNSTKE